MKWIATVIVALVLPSLRAQEWPAVGGDAGGMKYSALDQINKKNVKQLQVAWEFDTGEWSDGSTYPSRSAFEATPLVIGEVMYVTSPFCHLFALDAETGEKLWDFDPRIDRGARLNLFVNRGVAYWSGDGQERIFLGDLHGRLWSLDARTGKPDSAFGKEGMKDLTVGMVEGFDRSWYRLPSPVAVCGDVLVAGGWVPDGRPRGPSGDVRGIDAKTGEVKWRFHTVPRPGEFGHDTWSGDSWKGRGGTNMWSLASVDEERGMVLLPLTSPSYDFYGGDRKGQNLFGNSVVALDCATGERVWHYQTIHHDLWDWDLASQPTLVTIERDGKQVPAVAQASKQGFLYVLHRETGEPLFPTPEQDVPKVEIEGEASWPTQPIPAKPPAFARQTMTRDEITNVTPESRAECLEMTEGAVFGEPLYHAIHEQPTVLFPGLNGGANWGGTAFDPAENVLYVNSMDVGGLFRLVRRGDEDEFTYSLRGGKYEFFWDKNGYPCQEPPWGHLTAIDLNTGEFRWRVVLGEFDELTKRGVPKTGAPNIGGPIVTAGGLVFIGATNDRKFRAFDKETGEELWMARLPASGMASPMTYEGKKSGKQYVAIAAGGGNKYDAKFTGKLIVYSLPGKARRTASRYAKPK